MITPPASVEPNIETCVASGRRSAVALRRSALPSTATSHSSESAAVSAMSRIAAQSASIAGNASVQRSSTSIRAASVASKRDMPTNVAPTARQPLNGCSAPSPASGSGLNRRSPGSIGKRCSARMRAERISPSWLSREPRSESAGEYTISPVSESATARCLRRTTAPGVCAASARRSVPGWTRCSSSGASGFLTSGPAIRTLRSAWRVTSRSCALRRPGSSGTPIAPSRAAP